LKNEAVRRVILASRYSSKSRP